MFIHRHGGRGEVRPNNVYHNVYHSVVGGQRIGTGPENQRISDSLRPECPHIYTKYLLVPLTHLPKPAVAYIQKPLKNKNSVY